MFRGDPRVDPDPFHLTYEVRVGHLLELFPGEGEVALAEDPHFPGHRHRGELVVPRDHDDPDPRLLAATDRLDRVGAGRIHHPGEAEEREVRLERVLLQRRQLPVKFAHRKTDHAERPCRQLLVPELVLAPIVLGQGSPFSVHDVVGTARENPLGSALHMEDRGHSSEAA